MTTELGGELLERIRLRAYYLSLDRPGSSDKLNWLEAEAFERAALLSPAPEPIAEEPEPPAEPIAEPEPVVASVAPEPLAAEPEPAAPINPLRYLEAPLGRLSKRFKPAELAPRVVDLTSNEEPLLAEALWDSAAAELLALDHLNNKGLLQSLGGLAGPRSPSAFQACLGQKKVNVGVELKPAIGSGFSKLRLRIAEGVSALGQRLGQELESVTWYRGRAAAATSGANDGVTAFLSSLETLTSRPTGALPLQVCALQFDVVIAERAAEGPASLVSQALPAFKKQLEARSKEAERAADAPAAFLLANVILPAASDETDEPATRLLEAAARRASAGAAHLANSAGSLWLGLLQLDLREPTPRTTLLVRPAANWPMPSRELATLLEASIAVL